MVPGFYSRVEIEVKIEIEVKNHKIDCDFKLSQFYTLNALFCTSNALIQNFFIDLGTYAN